MKNKTNILNENIDRISNLMGLEKIILEQAANPYRMGYETIDYLVKNADDIPDVLNKFFRLTDSEADDIIKSINRTGKNNIADDVLEVLVKNSKNDMDSLVRLLKAGGYLSEVRPIERAIFSAFEKESTIPAQMRMDYLAKYDEIIDSFEWLADDIAIAMKKQFREEVNDRFSKKFYAQLTAKEQRVLAKSLRRGWRRNSRRIRRLLRDQKKSIEQLQGEIEDLAAGYQRSVLTNGPSSQKTKAYVTAVDEKLNAIESLQDGAADKVWNEIQEGLPQIMKNSMDEIGKKYPESQKLRALREASSEDETLLKNAAEVIENLFPARKFWKRVDVGDGTTQIRLQSPIKPLSGKKYFNLATTGQARTFEETYAKFIRTSDPAKVKGQTLVMIMAQGVIIPVALKMLELAAIRGLTALEDNSELYNETKEFLNIPSAEKIWNLGDEKDIATIAWDTFMKIFDDSPNKSFLESQRTIEWSDLNPANNSLIPSLVAIMGGDYNRGMSPEEIEENAIQNIPVIVDPAPVVANIPDDLDRTLEILFTNEYDSILRLIKVEGDDIIFKCGNNRGPGKFVKDNEGWKMKWDGYDGTYTIKDNLSLDNCDLLESVKGLANILLEQPRPGTEDPDDDVTPDTSEPEDTTPSPDTSEPEDTTPVPDTNDQESDNNTDPDTTPRDQERTEYNPSNRCVEELSTSYFCLRCKEGSSIEECNQTGDMLYDGECNLYDRQKIAREISQKLACVGMRPLKKGSLKVINGKLYFAGEKRDQETKMDFQLKKTIDGNNVQWLYKDEDGQFKDFIEQYHLNEHFLKNTIGLKNILENYRKN